MKINGLWMMLTGVLLIAVGAVASHQVEPDGVFNLVVGVGWLLLFGGIGLLVAARFHRQAAGSR